MTESETPHFRFLAPGESCWRVERADRFAVIIDGEDYYRAVKRAILNARHQVLLIGWDFDTRIKLEPNEQTMEGPEKLGAFLNWVSKKRGLEIKILRWNLALIEEIKRAEAPLSLVRLMWAKSVEVAFDAMHPPGASHHQKIVIIDDALAFCGGIDLTKGRWDTRQHLNENPARRSLRGAPLKPWHDATLCMDGAAAKALGELGRDRWKRATGKALPVPESGEDMWPETLKPTLENVDIGISRTSAAYNGYEEVAEIERLCLTAIAKAENTLYIESQYFASREIAEAMIARLQEENGPEIVLVNPQSQAGWLEEKTMGSARAKLLSQVQRADRYNRFRIYYPVTSEGQPIYVHAKIMVVDNAMLKIGSSNLNNRSMGFDSECDITLESVGDPDLEATIAGVRDDLLAEHLGVTQSEIVDKLAETGSLLVTIDAFAGNGKRLVALPVRELDAADEALSEKEFLDPIRPVSFWTAIRDTFGLGKNR